MAPPQSKPRPAQPTTLRRLAQSLALSPTTVSRALNGYDDVSEGTRRRVLEAARASGYAPNPRARSLATGRAMAIGHVVPGGSEHEIVNPVFADFVAGAGEVYAAAGYEMVLSVMPEGAEDEGYRALAQSGRVDGLILQAPRPQDARITLLTELGLPFVVHGRASMARSPYHWVDMDNRRAFLRATQHLLALGHRRIALLNGPVGLDFSARRAAGVEEALLRARCPAPPSFVCHDRMTETYGYDATTKLLAHGTPPTGVLTSSLLIAMGARRAVEDAGLRVGSDVSIVTHDDGLSYLPNGTAEAPMFTATRAPVGTMGREAAQMLLAVIAKKHRVPTPRLLPATFTVGPSTGPAP
ncbi:MAG: substrate-binding domain-containing protein [Pseudomonadota bacterium]